MKFREGRKELFEKSQELLSGLFLILQVRLPFGEACAHGLLNVDDVAEIGEAVWVLFDLRKISAVEWQEPGSILFTGVRYAVRTSRPAHFFQCSLKTRAPRACRAQCKYIQGLHRLEHAAVQPHHQVLNRFSQALAGNRCSEDTHIVGGSIDSGRVVPECINCRAFSAYVVKEEVNSVPKEELSALVLLV